MEILKNNETMSAETSLPSAVIRAVAEKRSAMPRKIRLAFAGAALAGAMLLASCGGSSSSATDAPESTPSLLDSQEGDATSAPANSEPDTAAGEGVCEPGATVVVKSGKEGTTLRDQPSISGAALFFMDVKARMKVISCVADLDASNNLQWVNVDTAIETNTEKTYQFNAQKTPVPVNASASRKGYVREDLVEAAQ